MSNLLTPPDDNLIHFRLTEAKGDGFNAATQTLHAEDALYACNPLTMAFPSSGLVPG